MSEREDSGVDDGDGVGHLERSQKPRRKVRNIRAAIRAVRLSRSYGGESSMISKHRTNGFCPARRTQDSQSWDDQPQALCALTPGAWA